MNHISVLGAGAWGTALALAAFRAGFKVTLWSVSHDEVNDINTSHENRSRLPGVALDPSLYATMDFKEAAKANLIILAPPAQFMRSTCQVFHNSFSPGIPLIIASKGIENESAFLMSEVVREYFPQNPLLVLSGPSFASEAAKQVPTAVALAADNLTLSQEMADRLSSQYFRFYPSADIIGVQVGGACKNFIAIACGIIEGLGLGENARAALLTHGLAEIVRLGCAMGADHKTFLGLSGLGDLTLTSFSGQSRNKSFGFALGQGTSLTKLLSTKETLTEGLHTVSGAVLLAKKYQVEMPLTFAMDDFFNHRKSLEKLVDDFFQGPAKKETV